MKIVVIGTRGIPDIMGGVETHCQELYPRIVSMGHDVTVVRRTPYVNDSNRVSSYKGVKIIDVFAPRRKSFEAITHTFLAVLKAHGLRPDILHVHAIGPAIMIPFAKALGMKVVMTNHGPDYDRDKWGRLAKNILKTGEKFSSRHADRVIVISKTIADIVSKKYGRTDSCLIFNGVTTPTVDASGLTDFLNNRWGIDKPYIVAAGRFVKEKGFHDLITAFRKSNLSKTMRLVIAGDADHPDSYSESLKSMAAKEEGVILTGMIRGNDYNSLLAGATLFVIPSYHEGLPFTLLEAMSHGVDVLASDIAANRLPELDVESDFFPVGNVDELARAIVRKVAQPRKRAYNLDNYNWDNIARSTVEVYRSVVNADKGNA